MADQLTVRCPDCCHEIWGRGHCECGLIWVEEETYGISPDYYTDWLVSDLETYLR